MDKIEKFLKKLSQKELLLIEEVIGQLFSQDTDNLDLKKSKNIL